MEQIAEQERTAHERWQRDKRRELDYCMCFFVCNGCIRLDDTVTRALRLEEHKALRASMAQQKQDDEQAFEEWCRVQREQHRVWMERMSAEKDRLLRMAVEKDEFAAMVMARRRKMWQAVRDQQWARDKAKFQRDEEARLAADRQKRHAAASARVLATSGTTTAIRGKPVRQFFDLCVFFGQTLGQRFERADSVAAERGQTVWFAVCAFASQRIRQTGNGTVGIYRGRDYFVSLDVAVENRATKPMASFAR